MSKQLELQHAELQQTQQKSLSTKEVIVYLSEKFPQCFSLESEVKPLKIGLFQELAEALSEETNISKTLLRQALRAYTANWHYLQNCKEGAVRVGLLGEEAGVVDASQAAHAAQTLEQAKARFAEKRIQQRKAQRKAFFKRQAKEANMKKQGELKKGEPMASLESLAALESKFSRY
ncbi:MAG: RNA chaperone ProQ [Pasteurellaceae bacterium]|nr:RNA chaperone ProQ [Pasteurellaceae bacterium]